MSIGGGSTASLTNWVRDLTFAEVHAMTYGLVHGAGMVACFYVGHLAGFGLLRDASLALFVAFLVLNGWVKTEKTKAIPLVSSIIEALPKAIVGQIRDELHYYDGLFIAGVALMTALAELFTGGVFLL